MQPTHRPIPAIRHTLGLPGQGVTLDLAYDEGTLRIGVNAETSLAGGAGRRVPLAFAYATSDEDPFAVYDESPESQFRLDDGSLRIDATGAAVTDVNANSLVLEVEEPGAELTISSFDPNRVPYVAGSATGLGHPAEAPWDRVGVAASDVSEIGRDDAVLEARGIPDDDEEQLLRLHLNPARLPNVPGNARVRLDYSEPSGIGNASLDLGSLDGGTWREWQRVPGDPAAARIDLLLVDADTFVIYALAEAPAVVRSPDASANA